MVAWVLKIMLANVSDCRHKTWKNISSFQGDDRQKSGGKHTSFQHGDKYLRMERGLDAGYFYRVPGTLPTNHKTEECYA